MSLVYLSMQNRSSKRNHRLSRNMTLIAAGTEANMAQDIHYTDEMVAIIKATLAEDPLSTPLDLIDIKTHFFVHFSRELCSINKNNL